MWPSFDRQAAYSRLVCPSNDRTFCPLSLDHKRAVVSHDAVIEKLPSEDIHTTEILRGMCACGQAGRKAGGFIMHEKSGTHHQPRLFCKRKRFRRSDHHHYNQRFDVLVGVARQIVSMRKLGTVKVPELGHCVVPSRHKATAVSRDLFANPRTTASLQNNKTKAKRQTSNPALRQ